MSVKKILPKAGSSHRDGSGKRPINDTTCLSLRRICRRITRPTNRLTSFIQIDKQLCLFKSLKYAKILNSDRSFATIKRWYVNHGLGSLYKLSEFNYYMELVVRPRKRTLVPLQWYTSEKLIMANLLILEN